jgi:hypothetical protein
MALFVISGCQQENSAPVISATSNRQSMTVTPATPSHSKVSDKTVTVEDNKTSTGESSAESPAFTRPFGPVIYDIANKKILKPHAERIAKLIGIKGVFPSAKNPVCCVWVELTNWTPNSGNRGYIINNQPGGSIIQASDDEQLKLAIKRFESSIKTSTDGIQVPVGLMTNYKMQNVPDVKQVNKKLINKK